MVRQTTRGLFLSFEGVEGSGKTTQVHLLSERLLACGHRVITTREPGGTLIGERIREILLHPRHTAMSPRTELLLCFADRAQHLEEIILPALAQGMVVITDRFTDSTKAYQGYARGIDLRLIASIDDAATDAFAPDATVLLDIDVAKGLRRNREARKTDRIEREEISFHEKVRQGFLRLAEDDSKRIRIIDASAPASDVALMVWEWIAPRLPVRPE